MSASRLLVAAASKIYAGAGGKRAIPDEFWAVFERHCNPDNQPPGWDDDPDYDDATDWERLEWNVLDTMRFLGLMKPRGDEMWLSNGSAQAYAADFQRFAAKP